MTKQIFLPSDGPTGTPSLRTLGTGATQAAAGNAAPNAHASTHFAGGSDAVDRILRVLPGPAANGYITWSTDIATASSQAPPSAGWFHLVKVLTAHAYTINIIDFLVRTAGTGATALANCFVGIYDSGGTRQFVSADQSAAWATGGLKSLTVAGGYTVTANDYIYVVFLVGTQSTTNMQLLAFAASNSISANPNLANAALRCGVQSGANTSLPASLTLSSTSTQAQLFWVGVR